MKKNYTITINENRCKMCGICVGFCPQQVLEMKRNSLPQVINAQRCSGCLLCYKRCPDIAIIVEDKEEAKA